MSDHPMRERCVCGHIRGDHSLLLPGHERPACMWNREDQRRGCYVGCLCPEFRTAAKTEEASR